MDSQSQGLLEVRDLVTSFRTPTGQVRAVDGVNLRVEPGRTLAVVGESGCGKSVTALSIMRLLPSDNGSIDRGEVRLGDVDLLALPEAEMRHIRGNEISMVFQEPMTALNPVFTIGQQIGEIYRTHRGANRAHAREASIEILREVRIPNPEQRVDEYPFQMSGGMLQRVMIAMALACEPRVLIADEPTTALDVTIQAQILHLMKELQRLRGTAILLITHDLGVVADVADDVSIMYAGEIVEHADVYSLFGAPRHPYTRGLLASIPKLDDRRSRALYTIEGNVPSLGRLPSGCRFHPRCPFADDLCRARAPELESCGDGHEVACHHLEALQPQ